MRTALIIAAAGSGTRYREAGIGGDSFCRTDKLWLELGGEPLWVRSLRNLGGCVSGEIVMAVNPAGIEEFRRVLADAALPRPVKLIPGGASRIESVCNALNALTCDDGLVAVHDAARPLADGILFRKLCECAEANYPAGVIPAVRAADTVKIVDTAGNVTGDIDRDGIAMVGTPQVFPLREYRKALAAATAAGSGNFTDDAGIYLASGLPVKVVYSIEHNTKVTVPDDFACVKILSGEL